jgi:hypothetical protein
MKVLQAIANGNAKLGEGLSALANSQAALLDSQREARVGELERRGQDMQLQTALLTALLGKKD